MIELAANATVDALLLFGVTTMLPPLGELLSLLPSCAFARDFSRARPALPQQRARPMSRSALASLAQQQQLREAAHLSAAAGLRIVLNF